MDCFCYINIYMCKVSESICAYFAFGLFMICILRLEFAAKTFLSSYSYVIKIGKVSAFEILNLEFHFFILGLQGLRARKMQWRWKTLRLCRHCYGMLIHLWFTDILHILFQKPIQNQCQALCFFPNHHWNPFTFLVTCAPFYLWPEGSCMV